MVPIGDFRGLDLTPEEGYLLSRIDGRMSVGSLLSMLGWEKDKVQQLLESLLRKHVLNFDRSEIADRVFGRMIPDPPPDGQGGSEASATPGLSITLTPVAETGKAITIDRDKMEKVPDLEPDRCVELLTFCERVNGAENLYQIFEIPIGADPRSVKRQYRLLALSFHPDNFFRKEIGGYRVRLENSWKRVQEAYELLSEPEKRKHYDEELKHRQLTQPKAEPEKMVAGESGTITPEPASPSKNPFAPPPPPPKSAGDGVKTDAPEIPPWDGAKGSQSLPPKDARQRVESTMERRLRMEIEVTLGKARRHFEQAVKDLSDKKYANADSNAKLAMQYDPKNEDYKRWYETAKKELETGIVTNLLHKAELAEASGEYKSALDEYEKALTLFPENVSANLAVGKILAAKGEHLKRARDCLVKGLNAKPKDLEALLAVCMVLRTMGLARSATRFIDKAKEIAPKDARVVAEAKELKRATR